MLASHWREFLCVGSRNTNASGSCTKLVRNLGYVTTAIPPSGVCVRVCMPSDSWCTMCACVCMRVCVLSYSWCTMCACVHACLCAFTQLLHHVRVCICVCVCVLCLCLCLCTHGISAAYKEHDPSLQVAPQHN